MTHSGREGRGARRKRRRSLTELVTVLVLGGLALLVAVVAGGAVYDRIHREQVRPRFAEAWKTGRRAVAARLEQREPLEFGAVWATHSGLICGVVNGWGSFGGLAGMTPFVVDRGRAVFSLDVGALAFAPYWRQCIADQWITLIEGSMQTGGCATRRGQERCITRIE